MQVIVHQGRPVRVEVHDLGLACCALEVEAAIRLGLVQQEDPSNVNGELEPAEANVLIVGGTITQALAPAVVRAWEQLPEPRAVLAFGACATSGGPYWDAPTVAVGIGPVGIGPAGIDTPVHVFVPGCPPRPEALAAGLAEAIRGLLP